MTDLTKFLISESRLHPSIMPQDVVKLCYQAAFGAEHILSNHAQALKYFRDEYAATPADDKPLQEYIAPTVCRVNLSAWKRLKLNPDWLWSLFVIAASPEKNQDVFASCIAQADELSKAMAFPFSYTEWQGYIREYAKLDLPPVRHSAAYRDKEKPAYRIISGLPVILIPVFEAMAGLDKGVIAVDGRAASGKSTLVGYMRDIISAGVVAMDDFFLPPELRTAERFLKLGGNIHHERFSQEVLPYLRDGNRFVYRKFDCSQMEYNNTPAEVKPYPWCIVEGVYSCHPTLDNYMDVRVFLDVEPAEQISRIETRNNAKIAADYFTKWISMEEAYFKEYNIREAADVVINTSGGSLPCITLKK